MKELKKILTQLLIVLMWIVAGSVIWYAGKTEGYKIGQQDASIGKWKFQYTTNTTITFIPK